MKLFNKDNHEQREKKEEHTLTERIRQYMRNMFTSKKCKSMSHGSYYILRSMSWAHGENWRRNHPKSLHKKHKN